MTTRQTLWPCFPLTFPYAVTAPTPSYLANDCAGLLLPPPQVFPHQRRTANGNRTRNNRKFFLDRSLFELLAAHPYLALTDQQLLGWYLRLSPEDRKIILEEGGLYQFLQRHPALELSKHHVYVKANYDFNPAAETNFTVNMEQGTCRNPMLRSHLSVTQDQSVYFRHTNISPLHSESSTFPECYRVGSIQRDGAESNNGAAASQQNEKTSTVLCAWLKQTTQRNRL
ncbi:hypothetical protein Q5P01_013994 [Channa striata]|uniref:Uncharacterized protein n=1 Tax=Channa striata TaxID=64152 RepID=A0AA88SKZ5_CHASR|nr:hypothetical protein Q5P01_013994 [Channa striata]